MGTACDVSAAAHLPRNVATSVPVLAVSGAQSAVTAFRLEGIVPSIAYRRDKLEALLRPFGKLEVLTGDNSRAFWHAVQARDKTTELLEELHIAHLRTAPANSLSITNSSYGADSTGVGAGNNRPDAASKRQISVRSRPESFAMTNWPLGSADTMWTCGLS